jgi:phosphoribosyl-AMP cyclohydrolase
MKLNEEKARKVAESLNYRHNGMVIAVAQDVETGEVLMTAFMSKEAVKRTLVSGKAHYFSVARGKLWMKGETSGNYQCVKDFVADCDKDAVLLKVRQVGVACHEGYRSCFHVQLPARSHSSSRERKRSLSH